MTAGSGRAFFRGPQAGNRAGVGTATGPPMAVDGPPYGPVLVAFGTTFAAESLPEGRTGVAGSPRIGASLPAILAS